VAVSLRPAVAEAAAAFGVASGLELRINAGGSGVLLQQIRRGAPADLLLSASSEEIDRLVEDGLADPGTRRAIASNRLVVVVPAGARLPAAVEDLASPEYALVAVASPRTAPLGRYTAQSLHALGLDEALGPRLVFAEHARQVLDYVARGEVDAGVVYVTDALSPAGRVTAGPEIPATAHERVAYEGVVISAAARPAEARAFLDWLGSAAGGELLRRHGFGPPPAQAPPPGR
jgi:molybdate transport system substrate-binding protein